MFLSRIRRASVFFLTSILAFSSISSNFQAIVWTVSCNFSRLYRSISSCLARKLSCSSSLDEAIVFILDGFLQKLDVSVLKVIALAESLTSTSYLTTGFAFPRISSRTASTCFFSSLVSGQPSVYALFVSCSFAGSSSTSLLSITTSVSTGFVFGISIVTDCLQAAFLPILAETPVAPDLTVSLSAIDLLKREFCVWPVM